MLIDQAGGELPAEGTRRLKSPVGRFLTDPDRAGGELPSWGGSPFKISRRETPDWSIEASYITSQCNATSGIDQVVSLALRPSHM